MTERTSLEERVGRLERENRRLRAAGVAIVLVAGSLGLVQCSGPTDVVSARVFEARDAEGAVRASLGVEAEGTRLRLFDEKGTRRASLSITNEGVVGLALFDAADRPGAILEVRETRGELRLLDSTGRVLLERP